jgi:hypothetical protein
MITMNNSLDNGAVATCGQITNYNLSKGLKLYGTLSVYTDSAHMSVDKPVKTYHISTTVASNADIATFPAVLEAAAIAKYSELTGAIQS